MRRHALALHRRAGREQRQAGIGRIPVLLVAAGRARRRLQDEARWEALVLEGDQRLGESLEAALREWRLFKLAEQKSGIDRPLCLAAVRERDLQSELVDRSRVDPR